MDVTARETAYASVLTEPFHDDYCAKCFKHLSNDENHLGCDYCVNVSYCSLKCQRTDWKNVHQYECELLSRQCEGKTFTPIMRLCIRTIFTRYLSDIGLDKAFNGTTIDDLETNYDYYNSDSGYRTFISDMMVILFSSGNSLLERLNLKNINKKDIIGIICAVLCNTFSINDELRGESIGIGLYLGLSKHNHSCSSKNFVVYEGNKAILRSPKGTNYATNLTISYESRLLPTFVRQKNIKRVHFFTCKCGLCKDTEKDSIGLSRNCPDVQCAGYCKTHETNDNESNRCICCGSESLVDIDEATHATYSLIEEIDKLHLKLNKIDNKSTYKMLLDLRKSYREILSTRNLAILMIDELIAYKAYELNCFDNEVKTNIISSCSAVIDRLGIGTPEVTRFLYIVGKVLKKNSISDSDGILKTALDSAIISHGDEHSLTMDIRNMLL